METKLDVPTIEDSISFEETKRVLADYTKLINEQEIRNGDRGEIDLQFLSQRLEGVKILTKLLEDYCKVIDETLKDSVQIINY